MSDAPVAIPELVRKTQRVADRGQFKMSSEPRTGALLRALVASKPGGRILEIGSGVGVGAAWLLDGMDADARLVTLEVHERIGAVCRTLLAGDDRVEAVTADAVEWLERYDGPPFDFVFVDTTSAKFHRRDAIFRHLAEGALFIADDLLPRDSWAPDHPARVELFRKEILTEPCLVPALVDWASGLVVAAYRGTARP
jgi:predicted O-methyltransferase YrrM